MCSDGTNSTSHEMDELEPFSVRVGIDRGLLRCRRLIATTLCGPASGHLRTVKASSANPSVWLFMPFANSMYSPKVVAFGPRWIARETTETS